MLETVRNETPQVLELEGAEDRRIILAPLEQRPRVNLEGFDLSQASHAALVSHWHEPPSDIAEKILTPILVAGVIIGIATATISEEPLVSGVAPGTWRSWTWGGAAGLFLLFVLVLIVWVTKSKQLLVRLLVQIVTLLAILLIGLGLPVATVYYFADGTGLLRNAPTTSLFVRLLQVAFITTASLLPVLLYFLFDRYQLTTIRDRLYRDLFRLDRSLKTRSDIDSRFGAQIREAYGPEGQARGRLARGTRWPVLVCAFVVTLGWLAAFRPIGSVENASSTRPLFIEPNAWTFGFLGAYFFGLQLIARRYGRGDLKPKAYSYITIRIVAVAVLSSVLEAVLPAESRLTLLLAFLFGIVPDEFFTFAREKLRGKAFERIVPPSEQHPLTRLDGIDLYERARLEQEGVVNIESLAHHDLILLVLETSIPMSRLVDWMDQSILYLHVVQDADDSARQKLREYGMRTATDLLTCWMAASVRGDLDEFKKLLGGDSKPYRLEVVRDALLDDEWLQRVQDWRNESARETLKVSATLQSVEARLEWADSLMNQRRYKEAIQALENTIEVRDVAEARVRLAQFFATGPVQWMKDRPRSQADARRAFELAQNNLEVLRDLIDIQAANDDFAAAMVTCDLVIARLGDPRSDEQKDELRRLRKRRLELEKQLAQQPSAVDIV
jgi:hypothetical protein